MTAAPVSCCPGIVFPAVFVLAVCSIPPSIAVVLIVFRSLVVNWPSGSAPHCVETPAVALGPCAVFQARLDYIDASFKILIRLYGDH